MRDDDSNVGRVCSWSQLLPLMRQGEVDRAPTYRIHRNGLDSPNSVRPGLRQFDGHRSHAARPSKPHPKRSACVTDQPHPEDSQDFERQFPAQPGRLSRPGQRLYFPAWDEALARYTSRVPIIPSPMGQLTVENHPNGFADTIMLSMSRSLQRNHTQRGGLDPGVRAVNPRPSWNTGVMPDWIIGILAPMLSCSFEKELHTSATVRLMRLDPCQARTLRAVGQKASSCSLLIETLPSGS